MSEDVVEYVKEGELPIFQVTYKKELGVTFNAKVDEVTEWTGEDGTDVSDVEAYLSAILIKWDSCSHLTFGENGYIHLCGVRDFKKHIMLMEWLYRKAFEVMGREPQSDEVW